MPDDHIGDTHFTGHVDLRPESRVPASTPPLPEGYECVTCGMAHKFPAYVFAHWSALLLHVCESCGAEHEMCKGAVSLIKPGVVPETPTGLVRTPWFTPTFYPSREGWYEARFYSMPSTDARTPDVYEQVRFDGVDWELEDNQVLVAWRGLVEDPAGDL